MQLPGRGRRGASTGAGFAALEPLEQRALLAAAPLAPGTEPGLLATYYNNADLTGSTVTRIDSAVNFDFGAGSPASAIAADTFSARWAGQVRPAFSETYTFYTRSDDGVRLWVNGVRVVNNWTNHSLKEDSARVTLVAGRLYDIRMEYYENTGKASAQLLWSSASTPKAVVPQAALSTTLADKAVHAYDFAQKQLRQSLADLGGSTTAFPSVTTSTGLWKTTTAGGWTSGFFPGSLWRMYARTGDAAWSSAATPLTRNLESNKTQKYDLTFRVYNTFVPLYALTGNPAYRQVILDAAASKATQFNAAVGAYKGWGRKTTSGNPAADFDVILDHMMDLELVFWAAKQTGNQAWYDQAVASANTVAKYLVRPDGSSAQWGYFNAQTGAFQGNEAQQGYSATSTWSRGQAWGIYGFTVAYRETGQAQFLANAQKMADWFINHLPADFVPYWDFNAPTIPNTYRDSSAAAVTASALFQLATLTADPAAKARDLAAAENILGALAGPRYLAEGSPSHGVLLHGANNVPANDGVDASLSFGDYYFLEALNRYTTATA